MREHELHTYYTSNLQGFIRKKITELTRFDPICCLHLINIVFVLSRYLFSETNKIYLSLIGHPSFGLLKIPPPLILGHRPLCTSPQPKIPPTPSAQLYIPLLYGNLVSARSCIFLSFYYFCQWDPGPKINPSRYV